MTTITIDGTEYELDSLSDEAKAQVVSLQVVERRIASLQEELAIHQTARNAYAAALKGLLPADGQAGTSASDPISWPSLN